MLRTLDLGANDIGDEGTLYLGNLLKNQRVTLISPLCYNYCLICLQTLWMLDLRSNRISDEGFYYIVDALQHNKVILIFIYLMCNVAFWFT